MVYNTGIRIEKPLNGQTKEDDRWFIFLANWSKMVRFPGPNQNPSWKSNSNFFKKKVSFGQMARTSIRKEVDIWTTTLTTWMIFSTNSWAIWVVLTQSAVVIPSMVAKWRRKNLPIIGRQVNCLLGQKLRLRLPKVRQVLLNRMEYWPNWGQTWPSKLVKVSWIQLSDATRKFKKRLKSWRAVPRTIRSWLGMLGLVRQQ